MTKCEHLALEQALKELQSISTIVGEVLYVSGFQELQVQFAQKGAQLNEVFKELKEVKPCD